ncbi:hypothetical protein HanPI659440_Chr10g0385531 [Helianthus annuus]|nr:hypothetical protein HanPI659440_Chr10g0385531 [Helianthus annuus]
MCRPLTLGTKIYISNRGRLPYFGGDIIYAISDERTARCDQEKKNQREGNQLVQRFKPRSRFTSGFAIY